MQAMRAFLLLGLFLLIGPMIFAQELDFTVKVNTQKLQTVDPSVFATLETSIAEFLNNQRWTEDAFDNIERIQGNLLLTITEEVSPTSFKASLAIQSSRPIFNSNSTTLMLNHFDNDITFEYQQFDPIQYSQNTFNDNLSAILSFYVFVIIGMDYDSFAPYAGEQYFQRAMDIVNTIPQSILNDDGGWNSLKNDNNRYWIIENLLSSRARAFRQANYDYHRQALDIMADDVNSGRAIMLKAIQDIGGVNQAYPNSMIVRIFCNAKRSEVIEIFKQGLRQEQDQVIRTMTKLDASSAAAYRSIR